MKTLHWYLTRQITASLAVAVAVFTFVLLLGNVLKEILALVVNGQAGLGLVFRVVLLLIPYVLVFALPMGLLTATLLVFGRFSADQELTAMRASGVSLTSLVSPILLLSTALCVVSALINLQIAPLCRMAYKSILRDAGLKRLGTLLQKKTFIKDFPGHIVYIGDIDRTGTNLTEVLIYELNPEGELRSYTRASEGRVVVDRAKAILYVRLLDTWQVSLQQGWQNPSYASEAELPPIQLSGESQKKTSLDDMTIFQLFGELHDLEGRIGLALPQGANRPEALRAAQAALKRQKHDLTIPVKVQIHRQISFSFACLGFALVGIPLGIRAHRRETTFGIAVALGLVLVYYSFIIFGQAVATRPEWGPHLILWLPNFIFQAVGCVLLWRANRSG